MCASRFPKTRRAACESARPTPVIVRSCLDVCDVCTMYSAVDTSLRVSSRLAPVHLCEHAGTTRLNSLNLGLRPSHSLESCGKLGTVEVEALACLNRAEGRAGSASNSAGVISGLVQRAVLLCLLAVTSEGLGQRVSGGGWVRLRSMVDVCRSMSALRSRVLQGHHIREGVVRLPRKRIMGWRPAWRILVTFIVGWKR